MNVNSTIRAIAALVIAGSVPTVVFGEDITSAGSATNVVAWWSMSGDPSSALASVASRGDATGALTAYPVKTKNGAESSSGALPVWTNAYGNTLGVHDPLAGGWYAETNAVRFVAPTIKGAAGMLRVTKPAALRLTTFTFETFVRRDVSRLGDWQVIAVMPGSMKTPEGKTLQNCDSWGLRFTANETLQLRMTKADYTVASGAATVKSTDNVIILNAVPGASDGRWHHLALSVDGENKMVKVYWDYGLIYSGVLKNPIWYGDEDLFLGATLQTAGPLHGCLAQVRIADKALEPAAFLRLSRGDGEDVLLHDDFESDENLMETWWNLPSFVSTELNGTNFPQIATNDTPGSFVYSSYGSTVSLANHGVLSNTYTNESTRGTGACAYRDLNGKDPFTNTSFTVECFYKSDGTIPLYTPFVRRCGGDNIQFNLGVSSPEGRLTGAYQRSAKSKDGGSLTDSSRSDDDQWHHAAMIIDYERDKFSLYRDYMLCGSASLGGDRLYRSSAPVCMAGVKTDKGNGYAFKGSLDDVRITLRALTPQEFLTTRPVIEATTLAHLRFEDQSLISSVNDQILQNVTSIAYKGGKKPAFSSEVPDPMIREGRRGDRIANAASLAFQTGAVSYTANAALPHYKSQTIEMFVKLDAPAEQYASIARCNISAKDTSPTWAIGFSDADGQLNVRCDVLVDGVCSRDTSAGAINYPTHKYIRDRLWHHIALAFEPWQTTGTKVTLWLDYGEPFVVTTSRTMCWGDGCANIVLGQVGDTPSFTGRIDEFRISQGVLDPTRFLRFATRGLYLIMR